MIPGLFQSKIFRGLEAGLSQFQKFHLKKRENSKIKDINCGNSRSSSSIEVLLDQVILEDIVKNFSRVWLIRQPGYGVMNNCITDFFIRVREFEIGLTQ